MKKILVIVLAAGLILAAGCSAPTEEGPQSGIPGGDEPGIRVEISCPVLEEAVRSEILKPEGDLYSEDLWDVYYLTLRGDGPIRLEGLEYAKNLTYLSISRSEIPSLEPIAALPELAVLSVSYSEIQGPIVFSHPQAFTRMSFIDTLIGDISFMADMVNMEELTMTDAGISDLSPLQGMTGLKRLHARGNNIESLAALAGKQDMESLDLQGNQVLDIEPLADLGRLEYLVLSYNPVTNLKPLENLDRLQELRVYQNHDVKHLIFDHVRLLEQKGVDVYYHQ